MGIGERHSCQAARSRESRFRERLVIEPKILLLDEPLSSLDAELRQEMRELIVKLKEKFNVTLLYVTHDQQEAVMLADKIALLIDGKIVQYDTSQTFYTKPRTKRVARFFGWTNFIPATKKGKAVNSCFGDFLFEDLDEEDGDILLTIRPEAATVCGKDEGFQAVVRSSAYMAPGSTT